MEISRRDIRRLMASTSRILNDIARVVADIETRGQGMVTLLRPYAGLEVESVVSWLKSGPAPGDVLEGEAAFDLVAEDQGPKPVASKHGVGPWLYATNVQTIPLGPPRRGTAAMVILDESLEKLVSHEARQLPKNDPSVVLIDIDGFPGEATSWDEILRRRMGPHKRVGATVVYGRLHGMNGVTSQGSVILNAKARTPLLDAEVDALQGLTSEKTLRG